MEMSISDLLKMADRAEGAVTTLREAVEAAAKRDEAPKPSVIRVRRFADGKFEFAPADLDREAAGVQQPEQGECGCPICGINRALEAVEIQVVGFDMGAAGGDQTAFVAVTDLGIRVEEAPEELQLGIGEANIAQAAISSDGSTEWRRQLSLDVAQKLGFGTPAALIAAAKEIEAYLRGDGAEVAEGQVGVIQDALDALSDRVAITEAAVTSVQVAG